MITLNLSHKQTHWLVTQAITQPKSSEKLVCPALGLIGMKHNKLTFCKVVLAITKVSYNICFFSSSGSPITLKFIDSIR
jgi:hypothetical protein